jgi:hypothetical protein
MERRIREDDAVLMGLLRLKDSTVSSTARTHIKTHIRTLMKTHHKRLAL